MHTIIKELNEILEKARKQDDNWDNYFEEQVVSLEEVVVDFSARMAKHESIDWEEERKNQYADWRRDQGYEND